MSKPVKKLPVSSLITAAIVIGTALYFINICRQGLSHEFVEHEWRPAAAVILNPDLELPGKKNTERVTAGFEQIINYEYEINGRKYQSNSVSRELMVNKDLYPAGKTVEIYYNPADETDSILVRTPVQKQYLLAMIGFCCVVIGVTVFSLVRDFRNRQ